MLVLKTGERFLDAPNVRAKPYYAADRTNHQNRADSLANVSHKYRSGEHADEEVTCILDYWSPTTGVDTNAIPANAIIIDISKKQDERANKQDFTNTM